MVTFNVSAFANVSYLPPDQTAYVATSTCGQRFSITYPSGTPADYPDIYGNGANANTPWKTLLIIQQSGGAPGTSSSAPSSSFNTVNGLPDDVLIRGIAIAEAQMTSFASGNTQVPGLGAMHHPGTLDGFYESRTYHSALRDSSFIIQHIRYNARSYPVGDANSYKLGEWIALYGANSAFMVPWCGSAPCRRGELGSGGPYEMSTVPNFIIANAVFPYDYFLFRQDEANQGGWFPSTEATSDGTAAATLAAAPQRYVRGAGSHMLLSDIGEPCHPKTFAFTNTGPENLNIGEPLIENQRKFNTGVHDGGHVMHLRAALPPGTVELCLSPSGAYTLSDSQMTNTAVPAPYYDGNLNCPASGHVAATARVTFTGVPSDGDLLTISDGMTTIIFEWDSNAAVTAGHTAITIGAAATATDAGDLLVTAITASGLFLTATNASGVVAIPSTQPHIAGIGTWTCTGTVTTTRGPAAFGIVTFANTGPADGDTITLSDGVRTQIFEADSGGGITAGNMPFTSTGNPTTAMTSFKAAVLASGLGLSWNNGATAAAAVTMTINSSGVIGSTPTWSKSVGATNVTLNQPTVAGAASSQSLTAEDDKTGRAINALCTAAAKNEPRWDAVLPPAGIRRSNQVAPLRIPATGSISFTGNPADTNIITINDGTTTIVFEFDNTGAVTAPRVGVLIGATAAATMTNFIAALKQTALNLSWVSATTTLINITSMSLAASPNQTITNTGANITVTGLSGGKQGRARQIVPSCAPGYRTGVWLECQSLACDSDLLWGHSANRCTKRLKPGDRIWVPGCGKIWACSAGGGTNVAKYTARECDDRSR